MKKIIIILILILLSNFVTATVFLDTYEGPDYGNSVYACGDGADNDWGAQSFILSNSVNDIYFIRNITVALGHAVGSTGTVCNVTIFGHAGGELPNASIYGASALTPVATPLLSMDNFTFLINATLNNGTKYVMVFKGDYADDGRVARTLTSTHAGGNASYNHAGWVVDVVDLQFNIVGNFNVTVPGVSTYGVKIINNWTGSNLAGVNVTLNNSLSNLTQADGIARFSNLTGNFSYNASLGGYFNVSGLAVENQTVNNNMFQSVINVTVIELLSGVPIENVSIIINGSTVINTTGSWGLIYPNVGNYTINEVIDNSGEDTFHITNTTFTVAAFDNKTHIVLVHQHKINVTAKNIIGNVSISNFSLFVVDLVVNVSRSFNTTIGWIEVPVIHNLYNITINATGFAPNNNNEVFNITGDVNHTFFLFESNSISFTIFDLANLSLVNVTVFIEMIGATITYNFNATNGTAFINNLNNDTYQITFTGSGYDPTILFATISGGDHLDIIAFMADNGIVEFIVQNQLGDLQGNVTLTFTQLVNGSFVTIGQAITDFSGRASIFLDSTTRYTFFAVKSGFNTFTGEVLPTQPLYTVIIQDLGVDRFVSIFDDLRVDTTFTHIPLSDNATANFVLNSAAGGLEFYGMNSTYNGTNYFVNTTGFPAGGIETFIILNISPSTEPTVFINYWFKYIDHPIQEWNATYLVSDVVPTNITIEAGLFDDLEALDRSDPIRGLMGAFIILALILLFGTSKDMTITAIGGIIGLGINWKFSLMPQSLLSVSMIVLCILLIADNIGGGR